jgi:hypothetical protein
VRKAPRRWDGRDSGGTQCDPGKAVATSRPAVDEEVTPVVATASYERWLAIKLSQGRRQFVEAHPVPFLIWREPPKTERPPAVREMARPDATRPDTARPDTARPDTARPDTVRPDTVRPDTVRPDTVMRPSQVAFHTSVAGAEFTMAAPLASIEGARIYPVRKTPGRPFPERVSVGRAPNCDIVIREASVSKLHAHFLEITPLSAELSDAKSSNGTRVNGVPLSPGVRRIIEVGDRLTFGSVTLEWFDAEALYDLL